MRRLLLLIAFATLAYGQGRELAPREYGPTPYDPDRPRIAYGGGRFLTVWREQKLGYGTHIVGAFSDAAGKSLGPSFTVLPNEARIVDVVSTGDAFFVFHTLVNALEMIELDRSGREVSPRRRIPLITFNQTRVAWNGTHFLAVADSNVATGNATGVLFTRTGEVVRRNIALSNMTDAAVVPSGDDFVVLITGRNGLFAERVDETGAVSRTMVEEAFGFDVSGYHIFDVTGIARGDGNVVALWTGADWRGHQLKAAVIGADGTPGEAHVIATGREQFTPLFVIRGASGFVAAYTERQFDFGEPYQRLTVVRLDEAGAPTAVAAVTRLTQHPPVAAAGDGVAGLAYLPPNGTRQQVLHRTIDANATISAETVISLARPRHLQPLLGAGGGRFLAAFTEIGAGVRALTASVSADGEPISHQPIGDLVVSGNELAWSGTDYLALVQNDEQLFAQRLTFDGEPIGDRLPLGLISPFEPRASVAWSVDRWVVVWLDGQETMYFTTVSPAGVVSPTQTVALTTPLQAGWRRLLFGVSVAADGPRVLISWIEGPIAPFSMPPFFVQTAAYAQRFRRDGRPIDAAPTLIAEKDLQFLSSAAGAETFAVLTDAQQQSKITLLGSNDSRILATRNLPSSLSDVAWDGDEYLVASRHFPAWPLYQSVLPLYLTLSRFDETLRETQPTRGIATLPSDVPAQPSVAAVAGQAVIAIQEGDPNEGARAVVYRERDFTAPWPPPRRRVVGR